VSGSILANILSELKINLQTFLHFRKAFSISDSCLSFKMINSLSPSVSNLSAVIGCVLLSKAWASWRFSVSNSSQLRHVDRFLILMFSFAGSALGTEFAFDILAFIFFW
jgi:hypothetical protein